MSDWQDMLVGDRMAVDNEFTRRVEQSQFSRQEWGLIMTATTFDIRNPGDEDAAQLVADTSELPTVMPELENVANMGPMGMPAEDDGGSGGLLDSLLGSLGLSRNGTDTDDGTDEEKLQAAERLVTAYAQQLQAHLEESGRWDEVRTAAAEAKEE
ncbi:DUF5799 family protein [Natronomonas amylolytica]|uniref:DUF5799 family protein n=1 Tax=Natronomonas amylolytica TaxID=3108498 RepID=UPI00300BE248